MEDFYCPSPWTGGFFTYNEQKACCGHRSVPITSPVKFISGDYVLDKAYYGSYLKDVKHGIISGNLDQNCQHCKTTESNGHRSLRHTFIEQAKHLGIAEVRDPDAPTVPQAIEVRLSNLCNFKCRMCFPMYSSLLDMEVSENPQLKKWYMDTDVGKQHSGQELLDDIITLIPNLKWINLTGGEPMILPAVMDLIDAIVDQGYSTGMSLQITTNCSTVHPRMLEQFTKFKAIQLTLSLDGVGAVAEYIRHGTIWDRVSKNVDRYGELRIKNPWMIHTNVNIALSAYAVLEIDKLIDYVCDIRLKYGTLMHTVLPISRSFAGQQMHPTALSGQARQRAIASIEKAVDIIDRRILSTLDKIDDAVHIKSQLIGLCELLKTEPENRSNWEKFKLFTQEMDQIRGENFSSVFGFEL